MAPSQTAAFTIKMMAFALILISFGGNESPGAPKKGEKPAGEVVRFLLLSILNHFGDCLASLHSDAAWVAVDEKKLFGSTHSVMDLLDQKQ